MRAQGKNAEAALAEARFKKAWERADVVPVNSRFARIQTMAETAGK